MLSLQTRLVQFLSTREVLVWGFFCLVAMFSLGAVVAACIFVLTSGYHIVLRGVSVLALIGLLFGLFAWFCGAAPDFRSPNRI